MTMTKTKTKTMKMTMTGTKNNILDVIGNTPIVKLNKVANMVESEIYVKLEFLNPGGSIKDRIGKHIMEKIVAENKLKPGGTIIEGTSGNTGVGLAMYAAIYGYKTVFVLADKQSQEKINNLRAFGAKVIVCPTNVDPKDPRSYYSVSKRLSETIPNSYYVDQYNNPYNLDTHYRFTGPEIYAQTKGEFDIFMAGVGTGGTISGTGKYLKEKMPNVKIVGVDIEGSILAHYHKTGEICEAKPYVLEGIGEDILPDNVDFKVIDDFVTIKDKESFLMTRALLTKEGIYTGGSGGAAVVGAIKYAQTLKVPKKILVVLPDSGNRYASKIFNDDWMRDNGYNDSSFNVIVKEVLESIGRAKRQIVGLTEVSTVGEAIRSMDSHGVSQLPVINKGKISGVVLEKDLIRPLYEGKININDSVSLVIKDTFEVVDINDMLEKVASALVGKRTVFITEHNKVVDILTNIDILKFISERGQY